MCVCIWVIDSHHDSGAIHAVVTAADIFKTNREVTERAVVNHAHFDRAGCGGTPAPLKVQFILDELALIRPSLARWSPLGEIIGEIRGASARRSIFVLTRHEGIIGDVGRRVCAGRIVVSVRVFRSPDFIALRSTLECVPGRCTGAIDFRHTSHPAVHLVRVCASCSCVRGVQRASRATHPGRALAASGAHRIDRHLAHFAVADPRTFVVHRARGCQKHPSIPRADPARGQVGHLHRVRSGTEDDALRHLRIDDRVDTVTQHDDEDVVVKAEIAFNNRTVASLNEKRTGRLAFYHRGRRLREVHDDARSEHDEHALIDVQIDSVPGRRAVVARR